MYFITLPFIYSLWWLHFNSVLTFFFFAKDTRESLPYSFNIKISGNYHYVNINIAPGESLNFSTLLLKTTCMKLLLWQTRTTVSLVWLSISFSKVHNYLALCLLFYRSNGWRIFTKTKPHNNTYFINSLLYMDWKYSANFFYFIFLLLLFNTTVEFRAGSLQSKLIGFFF